VKSEGKIMGLTKKKIAKLAKGRYHDRDGVYLELSATGRGSWLLRFQRDGRERWLGLGPLRNFTLDEARKRAREARQKLSDGVDPIESRREQKAKERLEAAKQITFAFAAGRYYDAYQAKWSAKHREAFMNTLRQYVFPLIGDLPVAAIDTGLVLSVLEPIWRTKHVTSRRIRARIELVLSWATVRGYRQGDNPARWRGHLAEVLPSKIVKVTNHAALKFDDVPAFIEQLSKRQGIAARALEFIVLTASGTGEVLNARWSEIDFEKRIWAVPSERMKGKREHRVPLTDRMIKLLKSLPREGGDDGLVFIGGKIGKPLSKMILPDLLKAMGYGHVTVHGMRSSFRTWAAETTAHPRECIEICLAHAVGDATERAYQRSDMVERRRQLMEQWGAFIASPPRAKTGNVTPMRKGAAKAL
jgi:integrase